MIVTPCLADVLAGDRPLDIAARFGGEIDDDAARAHGRKLRVADQPGRRPSGNERGGDDDILFGDMGGDQLGLGLAIFVGHLGRIAAAPLAFDPDDISTKIGLAPSDWICSFVAARTSVALTWAPRRLAVAIA
jgi:hypothetical protein